MAVQAQALQCRVPPQVEAPAPPAPDGPRRALLIRGYTLALSWSPEFCRGHQRDGRSALQCSGQMGRFGFILHGLWPEAEPGRWPQWCSDKPISAETLRRNLCMTPSLILLTHEWAKHGSCMARSPEGYFKAGAALFGSLRFPDMTDLSRRPNLTAGDLRTALRKATPFLPASAIRVSANDRGWLQEVHICYGKEFLPAPCANRGVKDGDALKIERGS
ncbi:MAG: ribonuclease T2 [Novosphingobium sp.]